MYGCHTKTMKESRRPPSWKSRQNLDSSVKRIWRYCLSCQGAWSLAKARRLTRCCAVNGGRTAGRRAYRLALWSLFLNIWAEIFTPVVRQKRHSRIRPPAFGHQSHGAVFSCRCRLRTPILWSPSNSPSIQVLLPQSLYYTMVNVLEICHVTLSLATQQPSNCLLGIVLGSD